MIRKTLRLAGHLLFISAWALLTVSLVWPRLTPLLDNTPAPRPPTAGGVNYLIVAPEALKTSAEAWAAYRRERGYAVQVFTFPQEAATVENIRAAIHRAASTRLFTRYDSSGPRRRPAWAWRWPTGSAGW